MLSVTIFPPCNGVVFQLGYSTRWFCSSEQFPKLSDLSSMFLVRLVSPSCMLSSLAKQADRALMMNIVAEEEMNMRKSRWLLKPPPGSHSSAHSRPKQVVGLCWVVQENQVQPYHGPGKRKAGIAKQPKWDSQTLIEVVFAIWKWDGLCLVPFLSLWRQLWLCVIYVLLYSFSLPGRPTMHDNKVAIGKLVFYFFFFKKELSMKIEAKQV